METRHLCRLLQGTAECDFAVEPLILILEAAVELAPIPGNDFCWSYWADEFKTKRGTAHRCGVHSSRFYGGYAQGAFEPAGLLASWSTNL